MLRAFRFISEKTSYCFAFVPFVMVSGYFSASYAFFIVYFSVPDFTAKSLEIFGLLVIGLLILCTILHSIGFGVFEGLGIPAALKFPRAINAAFAEFKKHGSLKDKELIDLLRNLVRFPHYSMIVSIVIVSFVTLPSAFTEYYLSGSVPHMTAALAGGLIAGVLYCYFCYVITESLSIELRSACRKEIERRGAKGPMVFGIGLRAKIIVAVAVVFFSMVLLVYFLVFCKASIVLTSAFIITTLITVVVLVWLYFRSVKAAFDEILATVRSVSRGGGDLLYMGNNEQELVEFADLFNDSVRETINLRENLEDQVEQRTRELTAKAAELEGANEKLTELDILKSRFLSSVSHELRTPLTSIMGFSKLILRDMNKVLLPALPTDDKVRKKADRTVSNIEVIQREGVRLTRLINSVLDLAKIESGRMEWQDRSVDLKACIEEAVQVVQGAFNENPGLVLNVTVEEPMTRIFADRDRIVQVLVNLLSNAAKFTREGEVSVLAASADDGMVRVAVSDTGPGIHPRDLEAIFERFHQGDAQGGKPVGTGLGLTICKEIVEHYGGEIGAESELGRGSCFMFSLPPEKVA